jgi:membrane carboxypeptidase/penicillin-binding protein PbpC
VLGGCEVTLLDHVSAMGVFANEGVRHPYTAILKITDNQGKTLEEYQDNPGQQVLDPQVAYQVVSVMTDNDARSFVFGPNSPLILPDRVVAAKTGTTQSWRDGWTLGYTPSLVAGVWTGNNDGSLMRAGADGVVVAAPIWHQFMVDALKGTPAETFPEPPGIQHIMVDSVSGKLPTEYTPSTKSEVFSSFALPKDFDNVHIGVKINQNNGKLATDQTPPEDVVTKVYTVLHSEMPDNPAWENPVQAWAIASGFEYPPTEKDDGLSDSTSNNNLSFVSPLNGQTITSLPFSVQIKPPTSTSSVDLYLNGHLIGTSFSQPFAFNVTAADNGNQTLFAVAHTLGDTIQNSIQINIQIPKK